MSASRSMRQRSAFMLAGVLLFAMTSESLAKRYSPAEICLDGKKVLECDGGDNGHLDADAVWATLKTRQFRPAEDFSILQIPDDAKEFTINEDPLRGELGTIFIDVVHGGHSQTRSLRIIRVPKDQFGHEWMIDPKAVDEMYDWRTITRDQAGFLRHPEKIGMAEHAAYLKAEVVIATWYFPLLTGVFIGVAFTSMISRLRRPKPSSLPPESK